MTRASDDDRVVQLLPRWQAESIRATIFPAADAEVKADTWWRDTLGSEPETRTVKPSLLDRREEGPFGENRLGLVVNPLGIIQWQIAPPPVVEIPSEIPVAGSLTGVLGPFVDLVNRWFPKGPKANRLAFGAHALLPVRNHEEGYETLALYLRRYVKLDPTGSSDFLYRINRPRLSRSGIDGRMINRLCSWSVFKMSLVAQTPTSQVSRRERFACRVELDINTAPTYQGLFDPQECATLFQELHHLGLEILAQGDTP